MLAGLLQRRGQAQRLGFARAVEREHVGELRSTDGERARLVEGNGAHVGERLEECAAADEDAVARPAGHRGHDAGR
jgi:hypothetical protein